MTEGKTALMRARAKHMEQEERKKVDKEKASQVRPNRLSAEMDKGRNEETADTVEESGGDRQEEKTSQGRSTELLVETDEMNVGSRVS